jgi:hypothetical protein
MPSKSPPLNLPFPWRNKQIMAIPWNSASCSPCVFLSRKGNATHDCSTYGCNRDEREDDTQVIYVEKGKEVCQAVQP